MDPVTRWERIVTQLGVPTVIAGVLLWWVLSRLSTVLDAVVVELQQQTQALQAIQQHLVNR